MATNTLNETFNKLWQFTDSNGFVVRDWTGVNPGEEPVVMVLKSNDFINYIAEAARDNRKIAVYSIGPCVLDWSGPDHAH